MVLPSQQQVSKQLYKRQPEQDIAQAINQRQSHSKNAKNLSAEQDRSAKEEKQADFQIRKVQNERVTKPGSIPDAKIPLTQDQVALSAPKETHSKIDIAKLDLLNQQKQLWEHLQLLKLLRQDYLGAKKQNFSKM